MVPLKIECDGLEDRISHTTSRRRYLSSLRIFSSFVSRHLSMHL